MARSSYETLREIDSRRKDYVGFIRKGLKGDVSSSPFVALDPDRRTTVESNIGEIKKKNNIIALLESVNSYLQAAESLSTNADKEAAATEALKKIQAATFPRIAEITTLLEKAEISGTLPEGVGEEDELITELEILQFIYGQANIAEVRQFVTDENNRVVTAQTEANRLRLEAEAARTETERLQKEAEIEAARLERERKERAEKASPEYIQKERLARAKELPNDFFRYLYDNNVPFNLVDVRKRNGESDHDYEHRLHKQFMILGDIFYSLILNKTTNEMRYDYMTLPNPIHSKEAVGQFLGKTSSSGSYTAESLMNSITVGLTDVAAENANHVKERFENLFNTLNWITSVGTKMEGIQSVESLATLYWPIGDDSKKQPGAQSWWDRYFWEQIGGRPGDDGEWKDGVWTEVRYRYFDKTKVGTDDTLEDGVDNGGWMGVEKNMQEQFLEAVGGIFDAAKFPGMEQMGATFPQLLTHMPKPLRPGTGYFVYVGARRASDKRHRPKMIRERAYPSSAMFPLRTAPDGEKIRRLAALDKVKNRVQRGENPLAEYSARYMTLIAGNLLESWLEGMKQDCELVPAKGASIDWVKELKIDAVTQATITDDMTKSGYNPMRSKDPVVQGLMEWAFTSKEHVYTAPADAIPDAPNYAIRGLTLIEKLVLQKKLKLNVSGIREIDKSMHPTAYSEKVVSGEDDIESSYKTRTLGVVKQMMFTYGEYFYDTKSGRTLNELLNDAVKARTPADRRRAFARIRETINSGATQTWGNSLKDGATLDGIQTNGFKGGTLLNIGEVDIKKSEVSKINEAYISSLRGFFRVLNGYQYSRDIRANAGMEEEFFAGRGEFSPDMGKNWMIVRVVDKKTGEVGQRLMRAQTIYHLQPQDLYRFVDKEATYGKDGVGGQWADPFRGVPVMEIVMDGIDNTLGGKDHLKKGGNNKEYLAQYVDTLMMRHLVTAYFYMVSGTDTLQKLKRSDKILFGMVFSAEVREKYERGEYTMGPVAQALKTVLKNLIGGYLDHEFFDIEVPDIMSRNLFTERGFYNMLLDMGFLNTLEDVQHELKTQAGELTKIFG
jgi:hypothetical protein